MRPVWIFLILPLVWASPVPVADLEEAIDVLLTTVEAHERKIKALQDEMYNVGDVLEKQAFLLRQLEEIVEDKKDPGYADEIGAEEVNEDRVAKQVLSEEIQKIRNLKPEPEAYPIEEYETEDTVFGQTEVEEPEEESEESNETDSTEISSEEENAESPEIETESETAKESTEKVKESAEK